VIVINIYELLNPSENIISQRTDHLRSLVSQRRLEKTVSALNLIKNRFKDSTPIDQSLSILLDLPKHLQIAVTSHPTFSFWLHAIRRVSIVSAENPNYDRNLINQLNTLILAPLVESKNRNDIELYLSTDSHGGIRCPNYSRYLEFGSTYSYKDAYARLNYDELTIIFENGSTMYVPTDDICGSSMLEPTPNIDDHGYTITRFPLVADNTIEVYNRDPWLRVKLSGTNQRSDGVIFDKEDLEDYPSDFDIRSLELALAEIKKIWPEQYEDMKKITRTIVPIRPGKEPNVSSPVSSNRAFTVSSRQGAIFLGILGVVPVIEMLIHENAHIKLRMIQELDSLLKDMHDVSSTFSVPWRKDKRPLPGILEGTYVFTHISEFLLRQLIHTFSSEIKNTLAKTKSDVMYSLDILEKNADLTSIGMHFIQNMHDWIISINHRYDKLIK
jgi:hypothetical protein